MESKLAFPYNILCVEGGKGRVGMLVSDCFLIGGDFLNSEKQ